MIDITLEKDFVSRVGTELDLFSWKDAKVANCRCPYCGDSKKKKTKRRGYFFIGQDKNGKQNGYAYKCWNCGITVSLYDFLEFKNPSLHREMKFEYIKKMKREEEFEFRHESPKNVVKPEKPKTLPYRPDLMLQYPTIFELPTDHRARVYAEKTRMLPKESLMRIYYVEDFPGLVSELDPDKDLSGSIPRIVFPLYTRDKELFGVSARCIGSESELRYITIKRPDSKHIKVYGLERYNPDKIGFCLEGALDSEFLVNAVSLTGASRLKRGSYPFNPDTTIMVYDNEPRNRDIIKYMKQSLNNGLSVCVWGKDYPYKDVNEGIQGGWTSEMISNYIVENSFKGLQGLARMAAW